MTRKFNLRSFFTSEKNTKIDFSSVEKMQLFHTAGELEKKSVLFVVKYKNLKKFF